MTECRLRSGGRALHPNMLELGRVSVPLFAKVNCCAYGVHADQAVLNR